MTWTSALLTRYWRFSIPESLLMEKLAVMLITEKDPRGRAFRLTDEEQNNCSADRSHIEIQNFPSDSTRLFPCPHCPIVLPARSTSLHIILFLAMLAESNAMSSKIPGRRCVPNRPRLQTRSHVPYLWPARTKSEPELRHSTQHIYGRYG